MMGVIQPFTAADERLVLSTAYVPEHIPTLMTAISKATPFLIDDYLGFTKDNWLIFVGYPLNEQFDAARCEELIKKSRETYHPEYIWFIGPEIPAQLEKSCQVRQSDEYLLLNIEQLTIKSALQREIHQAAKHLTVEHAHLFMPEHQSLVDELVRRETLPPMIAELYESMPEYITHSKTALVLNARESHGNLSAFFVIEYAAEHFDTYLLGCHSKIHYAPHASDLLFAEMISYTKKQGKSKINLGLGVNPGIRRFKMKWGGKPYLKYEFCEWYSGPPKQISILDSMLREFF